MSKKNKTSESIMDRTPMNGLPASHFLGSAEALQVSYTKNLSLWWRLCGVPKPLAESCAQLVTLAK